jgi:hypothetical protein
MISVQRNPILFYQYIPLNSENFKENLRPGYCTACVHQDKVHEFVVAAVKGQAEVSGPRRLRRTAGYKRIVFVFFNLVSIAGELHVCWLLMVFVSHHVSPFQRV